jgi:maleate cis-trans isomerase
MAATDTLRVGFISAGGATGPHFPGFRALVPSEIEFDFQGLGLERAARYEAEVRAEATIRAAKEVEARGNQGIVVSGAPGEVGTPDLQQRLMAAVKVPVATAITASSAALKAFGANRVLLMAPFAAATTQGIAGLLKSRGLDPVVPASRFNSEEEAIGMPAEEVFALAKSAYDAAGPVDAVYFQGAVLDPLEIMDRLEGEFGRPVVASNPAMLWYIASRLGRTYHIDGCGRLLKEWPALPA